MLDINLNSIKKFKNNKNLVMMINTVPGFGINFKKRKDTASWLNKILNRKLQDSNIKVLVLMIPKKEKVKRK